MSCKSKYSSYQSHPFRLITELYEGNEAQKKVTESRIKNIQYFESKSGEYETTLETLKVSF